MRIKIIRLTIIVLFIVTGATLFYIQAMRGKHFYNLSVNNRIRIVPLEGWRGRIFDRNGKPLADNRLSYKVMITPQDIKESREMFQFLSGVLNQDQEILEKIYLSKKSTPFAPVVVSDDISRAQAIVIGENQFRYPSLIVQESYKRFYPAGKYSSHVLGYVGKINRSKIERLKEYGYSIQGVIGYSGVEEYYDSYLRGEQGGLQIEVNSRGQQVRLLGLKEPKKGQDVKLTIDNDIQEILYEAMDHKVGAIVILDQNSGEVLGLMSSPAFDPNVFLNMRSKEEASQEFSNPNSPFLNRAINGLFPPGSVFKVPVSVAALESKNYNQNTTFICNGYYEIAGLKFGCTHVHGPQNLLEAIAHSCNVYFYNVGRNLGADTLSRFAKKLGLGSKTLIDLPFEHSGKIPSPHQRLLSRRERWYAGDTLNMSIGQGEVLATPIQLAHLMSIVANEGKVIQPHIITHIGESAINKFDFHEETEISKETFETVKKGLRATVTDYSGTAHILDLKEIYVAGKTGTAQASGRKKHHAWFVGYASGNAKDIAFCVLLEHGGSSQNANLVARQMLLEMKRKGIL